MDKLSLQNPVFATYVIAATLMILKAVSIYSIDPKRTFTDKLEKQTGGPFGPPAFFDRSTIADKPLLRALALGLLLRPALLCTSLTCTKTSQELVLIVQGPPRGGGKPGDC